MSRKDKDSRKVNPQQSVVSAFPVFWLPSIVLLLIPLYEIASSITTFNYPQAEFWIHNGVLNALAFACFATAAVAAILTPFRQLILGHLERLSRAPLRVHLAWLTTAYLGLLAWFSYVRFCQYRAFLLPQDTAISINEAYTFLHHGSLYLSIFGVNQLSIHIYFLMSLLSPILLVWNSPLALLFLQNVFICTAPFAVYALIYRGTTSSFAGFIGMILVLSNPYLYELLTSNLCYAPLIVLLPWAMFFAERRKWIPCAILLLLMTIFPEQVPFIFFGLGLYAVIALRGQTPRNWLIGFVVCAASVGLWGVERSMIVHFSRLEPIQDFAGSSYWTLFKNLVPAGTPYEKIFSEVASHPFRDVRIACSSIYRFYPLLRLLFSTGFLCLLSPAAMLPFLTAIIPHILATPSDPVKFLDYHPIGYSDFGLHQGCYVFGPLLWATALGIRQAYSKLSVKNWQNWLLVWALAFSGFGFKYAHRTLMPDWRPRWFDAMPRVIATIPPGTRVWVDEYASPQVALRRWIKIMQWGPTAPAGYHRLFKPDYVLFDKSFVFQAQPPYRDQLLTFFAQNGYLKIADDNHVILLKSPHPVPDPEADIHDWITLPNPNPQAAARYGQYLVSGPLSPA
jgi:uncharacterized membrane protein